MELGEVIPWVINVLILVAILTVIYRYINFKEHTKEVKPVEEIVAPVKQKRQRKKVGAYWDQPRKRKAARKSRKKTPA